MKKLLNILLLIPALYLFVIPAHLTGLSYSRQCRAIKINIVDSADFNFVTRKEIMNLITSGSKLVGKPVREISKSEIEEKISGLKELKSAEVYMAIDGTLHVYADQRNPIMRVMALDGNDYYIDDEGVVIRRRSLYTPRLHIVGGNINITSEMLNGVSILDTSISSTILRDVYHIVNQIRKDDFWSAQIDQIYVDSNNEIDLIPRMGNHVVKIGTSENFIEKLTNLKTFYRDVLPEVGWDKYSVINLKYEGQIVCKKR